MKLMWYCCSWIARRDMENLLQNFILLCTSLKLHLVSLCFLLFRWHYCCSRVKYCDSNTFYSICSMYHMTNITIYNIHVVFIDLKKKKQKKKKAVGWFESASVLVIKRCFLTSFITPHIWLSVLVLICSHSPGKTGANDTLTIFSYYSKWCCFLL